MNTLEFLRNILPESGLYIIARLTGKGFRHQVCDTLEEAAEYVKRFDASGVPTYHACAAYLERNVDTVKPNGDVWHQVRVHKNVRALKSFWMDLDVEPRNEKKFASQEEALNALVDFCNATGLPIPMIVNSGGGLHIYWILDHEILIEQWRSTAEALKRVSAALAFKSDPACTSDPARVLRPVGSANRKNPSSPRWVELIADSAPVSFDFFNKIVLANCKDRGIKTVEPVRKVEGATEGINQAFAIKHDFPPCSAHKVAERCKQLGQMRDTRGQISEPHWYAGIQLLCHAIEGDELIHSWSDGHASYSRDETNKKIEQIRSQALGPTLCSTFDDRNAAGCDGCPFKGKISSPVQLGTYIASAPAPVISVEVNNQIVEVTLPVPPVPFTRGEKGGIYAEEDGITHKIYEYDIFPVEMAYDEQLGYETVKIKHWLPQEGWRECILQSSLLARPVDFEAKLRDKHIQPLIRNKIAMYFDAYLRKLRTDTKMRRLFKSQGWKSDDTEFVLGDKLYRKDEVVQAGFSQGTQGFLKPFHAKGSLQTWTDLTWVFNTPGFEPHAFMLLLAFAAPLLKLAGRDGFSVNALGDSGAGKSTMARFMSSVYGHPKAAWVTREDTALSRFQRLGAHYALPVYMDEATTIPNKELRDLVYAIPVGKSRASMRQDYTLREGAEWNTIFITTSNDSLQTKLTLEKQNAEAESLRLFEFKFPKIPAFGPIAKMIPAILEDNYGVAGARYVQLLVQNRDEIKAKLATVIQETETSFEMDDKERFWSQAVALTLYGGQLAKDWGLIDFDPQRIRPWLLSETRIMRKTLADNTVEAPAVLAQYLDAHVGERLVVTQINAGMAASNARPVRELTQRYERDKNLLYIARWSIKHYLDERYFNYNEIRDQLTELGILLHADTKKTLGAGTDFTGGQVACWVIKADHPLLSGVLT